MCIYQSSDTRQPSGPTTPSMPGELKLVPMDTLL